VTSKRMWPASRLKNPVRQILLSRACCRNPRTAAGLAHAGSIAGRAARHQRQGNHAHPGRGLEARRYGCAAWPRIWRSTSSRSICCRRRQGERAAFHVDTLDFYNAKQRHHYIAEASRETGLDERILKSDLARLLVCPGRVQDQTIEAALQPEPLAQMADAERDAALAWLKPPDLPARLLADFATCGLIGEDTNKLVGYLAVVSRKLTRPLASVIQSSSAAGKSSLMDAVLAFVPDEDKVKYSAMTGQSLFIWAKPISSIRRWPSSRKRARAGASLCLEALAIRRRTDDRLDRQGRADRQPDDAANTASKGLSRYSSRHGARHRRRTPESLPGAGRR